MSFGFLTDFVIVLLVLALLAATSAGWGYALARVCGLTATGFAIEHFWLGICAVLALTTLVHYVIPIDWKVFAGVTFAGVALFAVFVASGSRKPRLDESAGQCGLLGLSRFMWLVFGLIGLFLVFKVMEAPKNYDSGLYHFNSIRWLNEYPIVAGLGLLHDRLAFNSSWFELPALLNVYPYFNRGYAIAPLFILLLATAHIFRFRFIEFSYARLPVAILLLGLIPFLYDLPAPTPDAPIGIFQIVVTLLLIELLFASKQGEDVHRDLKIFTLVVLCATMVAIKLSGLVFAALSVMVLALTFYRLLTLKKIVLYTLIAAAIMVPHLLRGYYLSGAPLFPSTVGAVLTFDWAMSKGAIENTANWVYCWARKPGEGCMESLQNWDWLAGWWQQFSFRIKVLVGGAIALILGSLIAWRRARTSEGLLFLSLCCIVSVLTIAFWFFTAPAQRFLGSIPYTFLAIALMTFFWVWGSALEKLMQRLEPAVKVFVVLVFVFFSYRYALISFSSPGLVLAEGFQPFASVELKQRGTDGGLVVYQPTSGDRCFDAPLPCTPYYKSTLQFTSSASGFPLHRFTTLPSAIDSKNNTNE